MSRSYYLACAALGGAFLSQPAFAADTPEVVVTAERLPAPLSVTPGAYVITRNEIQQRGASFAADLLATVPGVIIAENGFGGITSLSLRGASSDKTLVLIDGVPVNDPSQPQGPFDFSSLDLGSTQSIEVLSGPQGSLWGSDAIGGVVAITSLEPNGLRGAIEGGSLSTWRGSGAIGRSTPGYAAGLAISGFRTAGVSNADSRFGDKETDGFDEVTVNLNGRWNATDKIILDGRLRYVQSNQAYDLFSDPRFLIDRTATNTVRTATGFGRVRIKDVLGFDQEVRVDLLSLDRSYFGLFPFSAKGDQETLRWTATRQTPTWGLQLGVEHKRSAENTGDGLETRGSDGAFAIGRWTPTPAFTATASLRQDSPQGYRGQLTARVAAAYKLGNGFSLLASIGQGFKAPSIFETTYPCFECIPPGRAKNLRPERAVGEDAGVDWTSADGARSARVTVFGLRVADQIDYQYPVGYLNLNSVRSQGVEFSGRAKLAWGLSVRGSYAFIDAINNQTKGRLVRIPRDSGSGALSWQSGPYQAEMGFRGQDQAPDVSGEILPYLIGYASVRYDLSEHVQLSARVENLSGAHYEQSYGYGEPGRMVLVGVSWR